MVALILYSLGALPSLAMIHRKLVVGSPVSRKVMPSVLSLGASTAPLVPNDVFRSPVSGSTFSSLSLGSPSTRIHRALPGVVLADVKAMPLGLVVTVVARKLLVIVPVLPCAMYRRSPSNASPLIPLIGLDD